MAQKYTKQEKETIIGYNQEDKTASVYTCDEAMIRKMDKLTVLDSRVTLVASSQGCKTYEMPRNGVKIRLPRVLSSEKRSELKKRARKNFKL